jgi:hypothetical protein
MLSLVAKRRQQQNNRGVYETLEGLKALAPEEMAQVWARIASYRSQGEQEQLPLEAEEAAPPPPVTPIHGTITESQVGGIRAMCESKDWEIPADLESWSKKQASDWMKEHDFRGWKRAHPRAV